ncbi:MAG: DUF4145 domain-containing protein [Bacteroidetes bacterium]|nr:DUF4145 domain-containing protein [Bacteroidota bacterium]MBU2584876.1 DUF4145 domain-containing protein [Bacteroidota bacterium]
MIDWQGTSQIKKVSYTCGFCGVRVGPDVGYLGNNDRYVSQNKPQKIKYKIYICPNCFQPTFFDNSAKQHPRIRLGNDVEGIDEKSVETLYNEARDCTASGAYTASVLLCRKLLMHIAVQKGAKEGETFVSYIEYLNKAGYIPPNGQEWVDEIRKKGNLANHEIAIMIEDDALQIIKFTEMLLRFNYEFPSLIKSKRASVS